MTIQPLAVSGRTEKIALVVVLAAGLLIRLLYLLEFRAKSIFYGSLMLDAQVYDEWARRIAAGEWTGGPVFYHAPLYPYLLAAFFKTLGHRYLPVYLFQILVGLAFLVLVYRVGRRVASPWIGLAAAGILVLYAPLPFFETKLMATTVALALSATALLLLARAWELGGWGRWLAAGAGVGLSALAHPASLLLTPVFAAALLIRSRGLLEPAALAAGAFLTIAPATFHNLAAGGGPVLISSQGGITFLQGNTSASRGLYRPVEGFTGSPLSQEQEEKRLAEAARGLPLRASEVSGYWFGRGLQEIAAHPGRFLDLLGLKIVRWLSSHEYSTEYSLYLERAQMASLRVLFLPFGFLVAGAGAGSILSWRSRHRLLPIYLYLLATLAPPIIFYVSSRYRIAAVPALAILSGVAIERLTARVRSGAALEAAPVAAGTLFAGFLTLFPYGRDHLFQEANVHYNVGNLYYDQGDYGRAVAEYRQALQVSDFEFYRINLGNAYTRLGRHEEAIAQYRAAAVRKPGFAKTYVQWAKTLLAQGKLDEARHQYDKARALGVRNAEMEVQLGVTSPASPVEGTPAGEVEAARRALAAAPASASLHNNLGIALQKAGRPAEAEEEYRKASELDPTYEKSRFNLGLLLESRGQVKEALTLYEDAVRANPAYTRAHLRAGWLLLDRGDKIRASEHFRAALRTEPGNAQAADGLRRARGGS